MRHLAHLKKIAASIGVVTALSLSAIVPALADDSGVSQEITGGVLDLTVPATVDFGSTAYNHAAHTQTSSTFQITVDDASGAGAGWNVAMSVSDLTTGAGTPAETIAASSIELASATGLSSTAGQDTTGITLVTPALGIALNAPVTVLDAAALAGQGTYTLDTTIDINVPAHQLAGTYAGLLTTLLTSGPAS